MAIYTTEVLVLGVKIGVTQIKSLPFYHLLMEK